MTDQEIEKSYAEYIERMRSQILEISERTTKANQQICESSLFEKSCVISVAVDGLCVNTWLAFDGFPLRSLYGDLSMLSISQRALIEQLRLFIFHGAIAP
jgi:hypothetical protein